MPDRLDPARLPLILRSIRDEGFVVLPRFFSRERLETFAPRLISHTREVLAELRSRGVAIGVGSKLGFDEVVMRSPGRFDVPVDFAEFEELGLHAFEGIVKPTLGADATCAFGGVVACEPESPVQLWHIDSLHQSPRHEPPNLLNVLVSLHDVPMQMGPTQLLPASHVLTNHLRQGGPGRVTTSIAYQDPGNCPELLGSKRAPFSVAMPAGSVLIFDDRILHRGLANGSDQTRYVGYLSLRRRTFEPGEYFEGTRPLYES